MLAIGLDVSAHPSVQPISAFFETALRRRNPKRAALQYLAVVSGGTVDRMTFRHECALVRKWRIYAAGAAHTKH
ncbi:hypothetical protein GCM10009077_26880 [Roseibium denhamense]